MRALFTLLLVFVPFSLAAAQTPRYAVYYTDAPAATSLDPYSLLVLDPNAHPDLRPLKTRGKVLLAYLSVGESADYRPFASVLKNKGLLMDALDANRHAIDVRDPAWAAYIVEVIVPDILARGFDGVMLDTADTVLELEQRDPKRYAGMKQGLVALIRTIRLHYPDIRIMVNRGFPALPEAAPEINAVLAESIYTTFKGRDYSLQPKEHYASVSDMLLKLQERVPGLQIYTLDYWPENDKPGIRAIYTAQRAKGFIPYVATPELQTLVEEP